MKVKGTMTGIAFGALGLIALEALLDNANQASGLVQTLTGLLDRALDPSVPLLPDRSAAASSGPATGAGVLDPALANLPTAPLIVTAGKGAAAANAAQGFGQVFGPAGLLGPNLTTYTNGAPAPRNVR